jgi:hypothetical protein
LFDIDYLKIFVEKSKFPPGKVRDMDLLALLKFAQIGGQ